MRVSLSTKARKAGAGERRPCLKEGHLHISSRKNASKIVQGTEMENYPASISNFESDIVICQNTEKI